MTESVLNQLAQTLNQRKSSNSDDLTEKSYVATLYAGGDDLILKKVGEESTEVILAAKGNGQSFDADHLVKEVADLWFHTMVLLAHKGLGPDNVLKELESRFDRSGLEEKAARNNSAGLNTAGKNEED